MIEDYRQAAANAYLIDEFLRRSANQRTDQYGGSQEKRILFLAKVAKAMVSEIGAEIGRAEARLPSSPSATKIAVEGWA